MRWSPLMGLRVAADGDSRRSPGGASIAASQPVGQSGGPMEVAAILSAIAGLACCARWRSSSSASWCSWFVGAGERGIR